MRFSQRIGKRQIKSDFEKECLSSELRNSLWTLILELIINTRSDLIKYGKDFSDLSKYFRDLWIHFFKWPIDTLPCSYGREVDKDSVTKIIRDWFYKADWDLGLDFVEFSSEYHEKFQEICNGFLKREMSAYRFVDGILLEINSKEEIIEIETAIEKADKFDSVKTHLKTALNLLADRKKPDYRNSIKESISAVESLSKIITRNDKTTLGQALKEIEAKHYIPGSLKTAFGALYGYTSEEGGIRHSLLEKDAIVDLEEARFMLIACSAFVNYLLTKI
jgi:hypothetical protein